MPFYEPVAKALTTTESVGFQRDACVDGAPWKKPLVLYTGSKSVGVKIAARCPGCEWHIPLRGKAPDGTDWTKVAGAYWPAWAAAIAARWRRTLKNHRRKIGWEDAAPMMLTPEDATQEEVLRLSNHRPSGGRTMTRAAETLATGLQPTRKALP